MKVYFIRHGMTAGNEKKQYIGATDEPLSPKGRMQAEERRKREWVDTVFVTGKQRTAQTARILFPRAELQKQQALDEMDFGDFEGKSYLDMAEDAVYRSWVDGGCLGRCPHGENIEEFESRVWSCFAEIIEKNRCKGVEELYFVLHGGTISAILHKLLGGSFFDYGLANLEGFAIEIDAEQGSCRAAGLPQRVEVD